MQRRARGTFRGRAATSTSLVGVADQRHEAHRVQIGALERVAVAAQQQQPLLAPVDRSDQPAAVGKLLGERRRERRARPRPR